MRGQLDSKLDNEVFKGYYNGPVDGTYHRCTV